MGMIVFALFTFTVAVFGNDVEPIVPGNDLIPIVPGKEITPAVPDNDVTPTSPDNAVTPIVSGDDTDVTPTSPNNAVTPVVSDNDVTPTSPNDAVTPIVSDNDADENPLLHALTAQAVSLDQELEELSERLKDLEANASQGLQRISAMESELTAKDAIIESLRQQVTGATHDMLGLDSLCKSSLEDLDQRALTLASPVAFFVYFNEDSIDNQTAPVSGGQKLMFDAVRFQTEGDNYNNATGVFTAPASGTYLFSLTITRSDSELDECVEAAVVSGRLSLTTVSACPPGFTTASNMATVHLDQGDTVHVQSQQYQSIFGYVHTTFFGLKL